MEMVKVKDNPHAVSGLSLVSNFVMSFFKMMKSRLFYTKFHTPEVTSDRLHRNLFFDV